MAAVDQAALDKKAQERKKANKKKVEARKKAKKLKKAYRKEAGLKWWEKSSKKMKEKAKEKSKAKETGDVGKKKAIKGVKSTKGGEYVKYGKKSKAAKSFRSEFKKARDAGKKTFTWDGRSYSTAMKGDKKKAAKPKGKGVTVSSVGKKYKKPIDKKNMQITESALKEAMKGKKKDKVLAVKKPSNPSIDKELKDYALKGVVGKKILDKMEDGGKVEASSSGSESNPFGWPSSDARKR